MTVETLRTERLRSHRLLGPSESVPDAARHLLAVQSQEFWAGRWALAVRSSGEPTLGDVDAYFDSGELVRSWTMRGTLHTIPASDLGWVLAATAERQLRAAAPRYRQLGLGAEAFSAAERAVRKALQVDDRLTRAALFSVLEGCGIDPREQRGLHVIQNLALRGILCQGPVVARDGVTREQFFVLVEEHIKDAVGPADPYSELFLRYVQGHGPATVADFAWWSGLTLGVSRAAAEAASDRLDQIEEGLFLARDRLPAPQERRVLALGSFEEYYISYADRDVACPPERRALIGPTVNGQVRPIILADGVAAGTWKHSTAAGRPLAPPEVTLFDGASVSDDEISAALAAYLRFLTG